MGLESMVSSNEQEQQIRHLSDDPLKKIVIQESRLKEWVFRRNMLQKIDFKEGKNSVYLDLRLQQSIEERCSNPGNGAILKAIASCGHPVTALRSHQRI